MSVQRAYDAIADRYRESKWLLFRHYIERYTLFEVLGDLRDRTVLDLACGEGVYARQFKRAGAAEVTGVDISPQSVRLILSLPPNKTTRGSAEIRHHARRGERDVAPAPQADRGVCRRRGSPRQALRVQPDHRQ